MRIVAYGGADDSLHQLTVSLAEEVVGDLDAVARRMREERLEHVLLCIEGLADAVRIVVGEVDVMDVKERSGRKLRDDLSVEIRDISAGPDHVAGVDEEKRTTAFG